FLFFSLNTCLDPIEFEVNQGIGQGVIINGRLLYGNPSTISVTVEQLFAFDAQSRNRILTRSVQLLDDSGHSIDLDLDFLSNFSKKIPLNDAAMPIEFGKSYKIIIETLEDGRFESDYEILLPVPEIDTIRTSTTIQPFYDERLDRVIDFPLKTFMVSTPLRANESSPPARLLWINERFETLRPNNVGCTELNTRFLQQPLVFNGENSTTDRLQDFPVHTFRPALGLDTNFICLALFQESLSPGAFLHWEQTSELLEDNDGNMLEPVLGQINSNIRNIDNPRERAFGYFYATQRDTFFFVGKP
ncbi:MAG: hypothetical protein AAF242_01650, partial [Bacteroidota bacterium]